ncbi:MAG: serine/threonine-protein phosphatase, partial [Lachnospiraceae bacterium]|nr:serine/threonine-protein phosphatase [Lachnospiraceae bacterium]
VLLAAVCDGMGGLSKGEVASAAMIKALGGWFQNQLPSLLAGGFQPNLLQQQWGSLVDRVNQRLQLYSSQNGGEMGTTAVVLLIVGSYYY